jgi:hypothetical protein
MPGSTGPIFLWLIGVTGGRFLSMTSTTSHSRWQLGFGSIDHYQKFQSFVAVPSITTPLHTQQQENVHVLYDGI